MRQSNAEWDFMGRTFLVLSLAEMGLREPYRQREFLAVMDQIIVKRSWCFIWQPTTAWFRSSPPCSLVQRSSSDSSECSEGINAGPRRETQLPDEQKT
jgi:hypothetical protein